MSRLAQRTTEILVSVVAFVTKLQMFENILHIHTEMLLDGE